MEQKWVKKQCKAGIEGELLESSAGGTDSVIYFRFRLNSCPKFGKVINGWIDGYRSVMVFTVIGIILAAVFVAMVISILQYFYLESAWCGCQKFFINCKYGNAGIRRYGIRI